jgi:predicted nucleotidyltransferase
MREDREPTSATDPRRIFETFERHGVEYIVIGGVATIVHGQTRNTRAVDFVAATDPANLERLAAALRELGARLSGTDAHLIGVDVYDPATLGSGANFTMETDAGGLDFFNDVPGGAPYEELRARALVIDLEGLTVRIAGRDDLIRMKQAAGRPQDLADIAALTAGERGGKD